MALCSLPQLKAFLNISQDNNSQDVWLSNLLDSTTVMIREYVGRDLESATYTEFYNGDGTRALILRQRPVTAINSIHVDYQGYAGIPSGSFPTSSLLIDGVDYVLEFDSNNGTESRAGVVWRINTTWAENARTYIPGHISTDIGPAFGSIKVDYTAGYAAGSIPFELQQACAWIVAYLRRTLPVGGNIIAERIGDYSYEIASPRHGNRDTLDEFGSAWKILSRYKEVVI